MNAAEAVKRYDLDREVDGARMVEHELGDYVSYEDHVAALSRVEQQLAEAKRSLVHKDAHYNASLDNLLRMNDRAEQRERVLVEDDNSVLSQAHLALCWVQEKMPQFYPDMIQRIKKQCGCALDEYEARTTPASEQPAQPSASHPTTTIRLRILAEDPRANLALLDISLTAPEGVVYGPGEKVLDLQAVAELVNYTLWMQAKGQVSK